MTGTEHTGLSSAEAARRTADGKANSALGTQTQSVSQIIRHNLFSFFNILNFALLAFLMIAIARDHTLWPNAAFAGVPLWNITIGIVQELRAKRTVDRLHILTQPMIEVIRDGQAKQLPVTGIVLGDLLRLGTGDQVPADCRVISATGLEMDESLLTGESRAVRKTEGEELLSGSTVVAGHALATVTKVSGETFAGKLTLEAKQARRQRSELMETLDKLLRGIAAIIIPVGIALVLRQRFFMPNPEWNAIIVRTVSNLVSMIPEGLMLMTSISFAVSVIRLGRERVLVETHAAVEALARIDTLCIDKTGTLTTDDLTVLGLEPLAGSPPLQEQIDGLARMSYVLDDRNRTADALRRWLDQARSGEAPVEPQAGQLMSVPFSSGRKWSGASFIDGGTWVLGSPQHLFREGLPREAADAAAEFMADGQRILAVGWSEQPIQQIETGYELPDDLQPAALLRLGDELRPDAAETLAYFRRQGVDVKVISGDHPATVSAVARRAGFEGADRTIDLSQIPEDADYAELAEHYSVFGRVSPYQKRSLLTALQANGHKVAMTGDGVNDVLALKQADCGVAMADGSSATRAAADLVLLDNNLSGMVPAVYEGRRVVNNLQRTATLFLVKTTYATIMALLEIILPVVYPLYPINATLVSMCTVGIPSFFLALKPNRERIQGSFLPPVLARALPAGAAVVLLWLTLQQVSGEQGWSYDLLATLSTLGLAAIGFMTLAIVSRPWDRGRVSLFFACLAFFALLVSVMPEFFALLPPDTPGLALRILRTLLLALACYLLCLLLAWAIRRGQHALNKEKTDVKD